MSSDKSAAPKTSEYRLETHAWFKTNPTDPKATVAVHVAYVDSTTDMPRLVSKGKAVACSVLIFLF